MSDYSQGVRWSRVNAEPFEYAIQIGPHGDEFVKLINGECLRRPAEEIERLRDLIADLRSQLRSQQDIMAGWLIEKDEEIERLSAAKTAALKIADERAIEAVDLRSQLEKAKRLLIRIAEHSPVMSDFPHDTNHLQAFALAGLREVFSVTSAQGKSDV